MGYVNIPYLVEILAAVIIVIGLVKMFMFWYNPKALLKAGPKVYKNAKVMQVVVLLVSLVLLKLLMKSTGISLIQILAVATVFSGLYGAFLIPYVKELSKAMKPKKVWSNLWLPALVWVLILLYGAKLLVKMFLY